MLMWLITVVLLPLCLGADDYTEQLLVTPLPSDHIYFNFNFSITSETQKLNDAKGSVWEFGLFPAALGEIVAHAGVDEMHLTLTRGSWRHQYWGIPVRDAPPGSLLVAWFNHQVKNVDAGWSRLSNGLAGLFCASLNSLSAVNTASPKYSFLPEGVRENRPLNETLLKYGTLPHESVCTENLTPWKKLLPCGQRAGMAMLLNALKIFDVSYHSLGVHYRKICGGPSCSRPIPHLELSIALVFDNHDKTVWSLRKLFGMQLTSFCPLASSVEAWLDTTLNHTRQAFLVEPQPTEVRPRGPESQRREFAWYNLTAYQEQGFAFNLKYKLVGNKVYKPISPPQILLNQDIAGAGQETGELILSIQNSVWRKPVTAVLLITLPWYIRVQFHTLRIVANGENILPMSSHIVPGSDRERPHVMELVLRLPSRRTTVLNIGFEPAHLTWLEYPPDAHHGFQLPAAVLTAILPTRNNITDPNTRSSVALGGYLVRLYSPSVLVNLPTPDFSMPYNVICLTCTVLAMAFGPLHNITTARLVAQTTEKKGLLKRLKEKIGSLFRKETKEKEE